MKKIILIFLLVFLFQFFIYSDNFSDKIKILNDEFNDLNAKATTLNEFSPDSFPGFNELGKTNQLVELLDFNKRKFKLLLAQYNLITDKIFPLLIKFSESGAPSNKIILQKLDRFTGNGVDSLKKIQKELNHVLLKISRIEKEIEMVQFNKKNLEISKEEKENRSNNLDNLPIDSKINVLTSKQKELKTELEKQRKKSDDLKQEETRRSEKIKEKTIEIGNLKKEYKSNGNVVKRVISRTLADAIELRINGLEIPLLNTTRTSVYLVNTKISTLEEKITNLEKDISILKKRKSKILRERLQKGLIVVVLAVFLVIFLIRIAKAITKKTLKRIEKSEKISAHKKQRYQTLSSVVLSFIRIVLWTSAVIWVLGVLNIDYGPFLLAAGGISLAIGFGAQSLVKDIVTGFFILIEEQFALGDFVEINGKSGTIEKISLRTVKFRSLDGTLHIIPNGEISIVSNSTYQWSRAVINIGVSYDVDSSKVMDVLKSVCTSVYKDSEWKEKMIDEPVPQGIISFGDSSVNYRILAKTVTGEQWSVAREFNIRLQKALNANGIDIPYNYINVINMSK